MTSERAVNRREELGSLHRYFFGGRRSSIYLQAAREAEEQSRITDIMKARNNDINSLGSRKEVNRYAAS